MYSLNPGEPPTVTTSPQLSVNPRRLVQNLDLSNSSMVDRASASDSGYEASPFSEPPHTANSDCCFLYEDTASSVVSSSRRDRISTPSSTDSSTDDNFEDCQDFMLFEAEYNQADDEDDESSFSMEDMLPTIVCATPVSSNCDSSPRSTSSTMHSARSQESSPVPRPSSLPIDIPKMNESPRIQIYEASGHWENFTRPRQRELENLSLQQSSSRRSCLTLDAGIEQLSNVVIPRRHPSSLPSTLLHERRSSLTTAQIFASVRPPYREQQRPMSELLANLRRQKDSDVSSNEDLSDDHYQSDELEYAEVFSMETPDVIPDADLSPAAVRRARSQSVNLPPNTDVMRDIGRTLRRLSDEFARGLEVRRSQRSNTISGNSYRR